MNWRETIRRADRAQRSMPFKIGASIVVVVAAITAVVWYVVRAESMSHDLGELARSGVDVAALDEATRTLYEEQLELLSDVWRSGRSVGAFAVGASLAAAASLIVVWLGLTLTFAALGVAAAGVGWPLVSFGPTAGLGRVVLGCVALSAAFAALLDGLRFLVGLGPGPVFAVARNVLTEAVRLKVSQVFIVLLILGLASVPGLLDEGTPLRYRVQSFLQFGTGGAYFTIALLTLVFSAATVAFEQRDRVIWQTMTKPVPPWAYIAGKWLGVAGLNAVLLAVSGVGVFLFTEHLRGQPAQGEVRPYVSETGPLTLSDDRRILQFQVLQASVTVEPDVPFAKDDPAFAEAARSYIDERKAESDDFPDTPDQLAKVIDDLYESEVQTYRAIEPASGETFRFSGLSAARDRGSPLVLRYKINAGSNMPDQFYRLTFIVGGVPIVRTCGMSQTHVIDNLSPRVIGDDGTLLVEVWNGDLGQRVANPETMVFPPGGLQVTYAVGGYGGNFLRACVVLWLKLAFLAMLTITAATFLSFPVACLVAFGTFFVAEGAGFLASAMEYYGSGTDPGFWKFVQAVVRPVGDFLAWLFRTYADLKPTASLAEGKNIAWSKIAAGTGLLAGWTATLFGVATLIFRQRELAMYSGK